MNIVGALIAVAAFAVDSAETMAREIDARGRVAGYTLVFDHENRVLEIVVCVMALFRAWLI